MAARKRRRKSARKEKPEVADRVSAQKVITAHILNGNPYVEASVVTQAAKEGAIPGEKIGRQWVVDQDAALEYLQKRPARTVSRSVNPDVVVNRAWTVAAIIAKRQSLIEDLTSRLSAHQVKQEASTEELEKLEAKIRELGVEYTRPVYTAEEAKALRSRT